VALVQWTAARVTGKWQPAARPPSASHRTRLDRLRDPAAGIALPLLKEIDSKFEWAVEIRLRRTTMGC